jgi:photosystem II stability/assembly factor-like uncharacterized protein
LLQSILTDGFPDMRFPTLLLFALAAGLSACTSTTDPGDDPGSGGAAIPFTSIGVLPSVGGNVTAIEVDASGDALAIIDGKLYRTSGGGAPQQIGTSAKYLAIGRAPNGDIYAITDREVHTFDGGAGSPRVSPIDPAGPLSTNGYLQSAAVDFGPDGSAFLTMVSNYPRMYLYTTPDRGATWRSVSVPDAQFMTSIAFGPSGRMYATGSSGFYVSTDGGTTWTRKPPILNNYAGSLRVLSDGTIVAWFPGSGGLHVSRNGGESFTQLTQFNRAPYIIAIREGAAGTLYALISNGERTSATAASWVARSTDGGLTWTRLFNAGGRVLDAAGSAIAVGLPSELEQIGGVYLSTDAGATWRSNGTQTGRYVTDIAFDRDGALLALIDHALFRRTASGWQALGAQSRRYLRVAANELGSIVVGTTGGVFTSKDNGATWSDSAITGYFVSPNAVPTVPALVPHLLGSFLMSMTSVEPGMSEHKGGVLYSINADGAPQLVASNAPTLGAIVAARNGTLYGFNSSLGFNNTYTSTYYTSLDGVTWTEVPRGTQIGIAYNSRGRYVRYTGDSTVAIGTTGGSEDAPRVLTGQPARNNLIERLVFGPDDRLYLAPMDGGLYLSNDPVR